MMRAWGVDITKQPTHTPTSYLPHRLPHTDGKTPPAVKKIFSKKLQDGARVKAAAEAAEGRRSKAQLASAAAAASRAALRAEAEEEDTSERAALVRLNAQQRPAEEEQEEEQEEEELQRGISRKPSKSAKRARTSTASGESAQSAGGKPAKSAGSSAGSKPAKSSGGVKSAKERVSWSDASEDSELCWFLCVFGPTVGLSETYSFFLQLRCVVGLRWSHCISSSPHLQPS